MAKNKDKTIFGYDANAVYAVCLILLVLVGFYGYSAGWFDGVLSKNTQDDNEKLKLGIGLSSMKIGTVVTANSTGNYNQESGVVAVQIDAEKTSNSTHTTFIIKGTDANGDTVVLTNVTQLGVLSKPNIPVTVPVTVDINMNYISGLANTNQILTSTVSASAPVLKAAGGTNFYPVAVKGGKPAVSVDGSSGSKSYTWTYSDVAYTSLVVFDLDWEGIDQMTSISDEVKIPIRFTNTQDSDITVRIIKNAAL